MRRLLAASAAVLLIAGCGDDSSSDKQASKSGQAQVEPTATIAGCAPECLPPGYSEPGRVPSGTYTTEYFFAGQMKVGFDNGWEVGEDSTGEFASAESKKSNCQMLWMGT